MKHGRGRFAVYEYALSYRHGQGIHGKSGQLVVIIRLDEKDDAPNPAKVL